MTREEAIRLIKRELCPIRCENGNNMDECEARCEFKEAIKVLGQDQKTGHWIDHSPISWQCDKCNYIVARYNNTSFCPNCGVKMQ